MPDDKEFDLDLSKYETFEADQKARIADGPAGLPTEADPLDANAPWDDRRGYEDLYSPETIWKASLLIADDRVHPREDFANSWIVEGSQAYVVHMLPSEGLEVPWATCNCPNGEARGGRPSCYHTAAVLALVTGRDISNTPRPEKKARPARS